MPTPCYTRLVYGPEAHEADPDPHDNVIIPLTGEFSMACDTVYADDDLHLLYREYLLSMEAVIHKNFITSGTDNVEAEVLRMRNILSRPSLRLNIGFIGLGRLGTINFDHMDVMGGPFPQEVVVEPLASNQAIYIRWKVMFRIRDCIYSEWLQYNIEQRADVDEEGAMNIILNMTYQMSVQMSFEDLYSVTDILTQFTDSAFQGMHKKTSSNISRNGYVAKIRVIYSEIKSDSAYYPYTTKIDVKDSIESNLLPSNEEFGAGGFYKWIRNISGTVRVPARISKSYAWLVVLKILRSRFKKAFLYGKLHAALALDVEPAPNDNDQKKATYLPLKIKIEDRIYDRSIAFAISYLMFSDLTSIIRNSKIFTRVNTLFQGAEEESDPKTLSEQWKSWHDSMAAYYKPGSIFRYDADGIPIMFNPCPEGSGSLDFGPSDPPKIGPTVPGDPDDPNSLPLEDDPDWDTGADTSGNETARDAANPERVFGSSIDPKFSWVDYNNDFEIIEDTNLLPVEYLESPPTGYYEAGDPALATRAITANTMDGKTYQLTGNYPNTVIERGYSMYYVRMHGYAIRVGHKIPYPSIISVNGAAAKKMRSRVKQKQIAPGDEPVYLAMWDILYAIDGGDPHAADVMSAIKTNGDPGAFV